MTLPTSEDMVQTIRQVNFTHVFAPSDPPLSVNRCRFLCKWLQGAFGCTDFCAPVQWQLLQLYDYPTFVPHPMDLGTLWESMNDASFCFVTFLDAVRLVFANACRYNPPDHLIAQKARQLVSLFEERVIDMQRHPNDDDPERLRRILSPVLMELYGRDEATHFRKPVDTLTEYAYPSIVLRPMSLDDILQALDNLQYFNRMDVVSDGECHILYRTPKIRPKMPSTHAVHAPSAAVKLVWNNAIEYCTLEHFIGQNAQKLSQVADRLFASRNPDVDSKYCILSCMRNQLVDNLSTLNGADLLAVAADIETRCPDAVTHFSDGSFAISVDALNQKQFLATNLQVRKLVVALHCPE